MQTQQALEELKKEYKEWNKDKSITRSQRSLHIKGYTPEQVYLQIKKVTDIVICTTEDFLAKNGVGGGSGGEGSEGEEREIVDDDYDESGSVSGSGSGESVSESVNGESGSVSGNNDQCDKEENDTVDDEEHYDQNETVDEEHDDEDETPEDDPEDTLSEESCFEYNSDEMEKITQYLEGDCESSNEIMSIPAKDILGGGRREKKYTKNE